jgi:hypothetical protein
VANRFDFGASGRGYEGVDLGEVASVEDDAGGVANVNVGELVDDNPALAALLADRELGVTVPGKSGGEKGDEGKGEFPEGNTGRFGRFLGEVDHAGIDDCSTLIRPKALPASGSKRHWHQSRLGWKKLASSLAL